MRRSRVISSRAPNGSSISSSAGIEGERAGDRDALLHAARELPGWCPRTRSARRARAAPARAPSGARRSQPEHLERQRRRSSRRCASRRAPPPGRPSRSRGRGGPGARSCRRPRRLALGRLDEVADHPQERRLAAAGRADQRDELAGLEVERRPRRGRGCRRCSKIFGQVPDRDGCGMVEWSSAPVTRCLRRAPHDEPLGDHDEEEEDDTEPCGDDVRRPERGRVDRVVLVEVEDRAAEPVLDRRTAARR